MVEVPETEVLQVNPHKIKPNPDNPRLLFDDEKMDELRKSIELRGVMVPLIVFKEKPDSDNFVLLDGERRLRCALKIGLPKVPINEILKPKRAENIIRMFNIHVVREPWELVPMAYSLETLIKLLEKDGKKTSSTELSKLTGLPSVRISECKRILKYKKYLHLSLVPDHSKRIGGDFFSQLDLLIDKLKQYPSILDEYPRPKLIELLIKKKQEGVIIDFLKEFRFLKKTLESGKKGVEKKRIVENVKEYLKFEPIKMTDSSGKTKTRSMSAQDVFDRTSSAMFIENEIIKTTKILDTLFDKIEFDEVKNKKELRELLEKLSSRISTFLKKR